MFKILDKQYDKVIQSVYFTAVADYEFALDNLVPLIDKLDFQRSPLRKSFYRRLENDIINGCIMPFLTIAAKYDSKTLISVNDIKSDDEFLKLLDNAFVLDGIQRLTTLKRIAMNQEINNDQSQFFDIKRPIYFNMLVCGSMDRLLYRMVTLNNGQKPMTARHQIEVLAKNIFDFDSLSILPVTEKKAKTDSNELEGPAMNKENLIKAYLAYISGSINIDNDKIIESKMDELITDQIMESDITTRETQYHDIIDYIEKCMSIESLKNWFGIVNNFIGFSASMSTQFKIIQYIAPEELAESIEIFDEAFSSINVSKIRLGLARRRLVKYFFDNYLKFKDMSINSLLDKISMEL
jgi:hypothetical protein